MKIRTFAHVASADPFHQVYTKVRSYLGPNIEPIPLSVRSRYNQSINLLDHKGVPVGRFAVFVPGSTPKWVAWDKPYHRHPLVEYLTRLYVLERVEHHAGSLRDAEFRKVIGQLNVKTRVPEDGFIEAVEAWAIELLANRDARRPASFIRHFLQFCIDLDVWGFPEQLSCILNERRPSKGKWQNLAVTLFDRDFGPFTHDEIISISEGLELTDGVGLYPKAEALLMRDWGLRPIQVALLREEDFEDAPDGAFISVPSVKGRLRSRLRRKVGNFRKRLISEDTAQAIRDVIAINATRVAALKEDLVKCFPARIGEIAALPSPLFPPARFGAYMKGTFADAALRQYTLHASSQAISNEVRTLTKSLAIPQLVVAGIESRNSVLRISPARFRTTKGTLMALQGYSPLEVAEALDHLTIRSVSHYFRFNRDVADYVNATQTNSPEINSMVNTWVRGIKTGLQSAGAPIRVAGLPSLGLCGNPNVCDRHPAMSCYSCHFFQPSREGNHRKAAEDIEAYALTIRDQSTGPVRQQLDHAARNARQLASELDTPGDGDSK